jgi:hypothetical protein
MTGAQSGRLLYQVLLLVTVAAVIGLVALYLFVFEPKDRAGFAGEIGKGLISIITVAVIGSVVKLLVDDHQRRLRDLTEARVRAQEREQRLQEFRSDKVRRLVGVTNILRRAPTLIDAHRSAKTYNEQMREVVNAGLELRLIRHETDAIGNPNPAFAAWDTIRGEIRKMEGYIKWLVDDFRAHSKALGELQSKAEADRQLQPMVWERIRALPSVSDLLYEIDTPNAKTRYAGEYLKAYEAAMQMMIKSSVIGSTPDQTSGGTGGQAL